MTPEEVMHRLNSRNTRIEDTATKPAATSLVDLAVGSPVPITLLPGMPAAMPIAPLPEPKPTVAAPATPGPTSVPIASPAAPQPTPQPARSAEIHAVVDSLLLGPRLISDAQELFDKADRLYKELLVSISIEALSAPIFPGKKPEDPKRPAGNDTERDLAITKLTVTDSRAYRFMSDREAALRNLQMQRNQFEAAKLLAALLTSESKLQ